MPDERDSTYGGGGPSSHPARGTARVGGGEFTPLPLSGLSPSQDATTVDVNEAARPTGRAQVPTAAMIDPAADPVIGAPAAKAAAKTVLPTAAATSVMTPLDEEIANGGFLAGEAQDDEDRAELRSEVRSHRRRAADGAKEPSKSGGDILEESAIRKTIRIVGEVFITLGLIVLLFATYEVYGKTFQIHADQKRLAHQLEREWSNHSKGGGKAQKQTPDKPLPGDALARIYIPKLKQDWIVVEGTSPADIRLAPGHYSNSQMPGQVGNFAVAGHRTPAIFWNLDEVSQGDTVVVETRDNWFTYKVDKTAIIKPSQVSVVASNPDNPSAGPTRKLLTLTTCNPKWDNYQRLIIQAELTHEQPKSAGRPSELGK